MNSKWNKEKENLEKLILKENKSYKEIGRSYKSKNKNGERSYYRYHRSASQETENVENPLNDES